MILIKFSKVRTHIMSLRVPIQTNWSIGVVEWSNIYVLRYDISLQITTMINCYDLLYTSNAYFTRYLCDIRIAAGSLL